MLWLRLDVPHAAPEIQLLKEYGGGILEDLFNRAERPQGPGGQVRETLVILVHIS